MSATSFDTNFRFTNFNYFRNKTIKRNALDFYIVNFELHLTGLIGFSAISSHAAYFNTCEKNIV